MSVDTENLIIKGITEPVILDYFTTINKSRFDETASLFAEDGILHAPFTAPVVGREKIAAYLEAEATGMKLIPNRGISETDETNVNSSLFTVMGKVQTALFSVNVRWQLVLNSNGSLDNVKIKLLASPQELLTMRQ
ncbi:nuclear transport factor 2 family protein [Myxosarcina sp. GI1]|uniref:nuclear transport factor 2 family protein n=1 Tax=Myxosarcina sp. GI1 TaxID=1541065 RepID=UPI00055D0173|nr:nuclear transport factor 2 family protein [Myxosarcina sp. GI1]